MKNKFFLLSTIISSCILTIACNQTTAVEMNPNMPPGGKRSCYPASKCTGDPNLIGGSGRYGANAQSSFSGAPPSSNGTKVLQTERTEKFAGTIRSVNRVQLPNQTQIQLVLTTDQGDLLVIVGPANFVDQSRIKLLAGDKITVTGYPIRANGNLVITAAQIQKNGGTLELLNESRQPLWGGTQAPSAPYSGSQHPFMPNSRY
jgi:hypothetical protein